MTQTPQAFFLLPPVFNPKAKLSPLQEMPDNKSEKIIIKKLWQRNKNHFHSFVVNKLAIARCGTVHLRCVVSLFIHYTCCSAPLHTHAHTHTRTHFPTLEGDKWSNQFLVERNRVTFIVSLGLEPKNQKERERKTRKKIAQLEWMNE